MKTAGKRERADHEARHDLVADAEKHRGVEGLMRQRHRGRQCDHVARKQRQLHARFALGDAIAHGRHAARHLGDGTDFARAPADQFGKTLVGLMCRQHVVVGGNDRKTGDTAFPHHGLVARRARREGMHLVGAA
jgi:hypothetical protein